jgi:primosomal protein N' (replication factor Y)
MRSLIAAHGNSASATGRRCAPYNARVPRANPPPLLAQIALPVPVDTLFSYLVPPTLDAATRPGCRALVPFGARRIAGLVVSRGAPEQAPAHERLRPIERLLDPVPVVSAGMIELLAAAARDVFCPIGLALACATPSGAAPRAAPGFAVTARGREALARGALAPALRPVLAWLERAPRTRRELERRLGDGDGVRALLRDGLVAPQAVETDPGARAPSVRKVRVADGVEAAAAIAGPLARARKQAALLECIARDGPLAVAALGGASEPLRQLAARKLVAFFEEAVDAPASIADALAEGEATPPELAPEQEVALAAIAAAVHARRSERFLLYGVTGSGKTEVYLRAIAETLAAGRQALVLVPEITLTHQLVARLAARFGERVAVLHSQLRPGERIAEWRRLLGGATRIAVGARSALFAPLDELGLIVIDEEHEPSYKNEEGFRYHARDLAARRAALAGCPLVLGSATPALESRHAAERGDLRLLTLPHRIGGRPLPAVELVDLERERATLPRGRRLVLSRTLATALAETLADRGQTLLFLNRRGFSTRIYCFDCGHAERCRHCDISLVYHASDQKLRCHYCQYEIDPPERCSQCGAPDTALLGLGTERLVEEVRRRFPAARIERLDRDTAQKRGETERVLGGLAAGDIDILVGTQMIAKGHHFPGVRLVGVVAADQSLHFPDFRAAERTFQLLTQVAGRAGRGGAPGRVVLQTFVPSHYAIQPVREHDYDAFYRAELEHRAALGYPPFGRLVHVLVSAAEEPDANRVAAELALHAWEIGGAAPDAPSPAFAVLGPGPAPIPRLRDRFRVQLLVKGNDEKRVLAAGRALAARAHRRDGADVRIQVDPNPVNML